MRENKFRAWDKKKKEMTLEMPLAMLAGFLAAQYKLGIDISRFEWLEYIGIKDRNGKEIYEGDIFNCIYRGDGDYDRYQVVYDAEGTRFRLKRTGECSQLGVDQKISDVARYGIVGNIYENKQLLKNI